MHAAQWAALTVDITSPGMVQDQQPHSSALLAAVHRSMCMFHLCPGHCHGTRNGMLTPQAVASQLTYCVSSKGELPLTQENPRSTFLQPTSSQPVLAERHCCMLCSACKAMHAPHGAISATSACTLKHSAQDCQCQRECWQAAPLGRQHLARRLLKAELGRRGKSVLHAAAFCCTQQLCKPYPPTHNIEQPCMPPGCPTTRYNRTMASAMAAMDALNSPV